MWPPGLIWTLFSVALVVALPVLMIEVKTGAVIGFWMWLLFSASFRCASDGLSLHPAWLPLFSVILIPSMWRKRLTLGYVVLVSLVLLSLLSNVQGFRDSLTTSRARQIGEKVFLVLFTGQWLLGRLPADTFYTVRLVCIWACFCLLLLPGRISLGMPIIDWFIWYSVFLAVFSSGYWGIIGGLGFCALSAGLVVLVRPDNGSSWRFVLFSVTLNFLSRMIHFFFCVFYVPDFATILAPILQLPFRVSMGKYVHVSERDDSRSNLCQSCLQWTADSKLIVPAGRVTLRIVEWHPLGQGLGMGSDSSDSGWPCHLCTLLWHLVDRHGEQTSGSTVFSTSHEQWEVKVWAEGSMSPFTYAQLHFDRRAVGRRLFIHGSQLFNRGKYHFACLYGHCLDIEPPSLHLHQASTDSDLHIELAREWLTSCQECHALCNGPRATPDSLLSRLLAIRTPAPGNATPTVSVVQVSSPSCADGAIVYCALSHSWGGSATLRLIKTNQKELTEGVDLEQLSNNIRDAILIAHRLGYQYIWVDSLCIVQDDDADWKREAAKMGDIYAGAVLTIAATGAESGDQGCFRQRNTDLLTPCELAASSKDHLLPDRIYAVLDDLTDFRDGVDDGPLNHRGWVLQERLLSRRILHFGERMIYWECAVRSASELNPFGFVYKKYPGDFYGNFIPATEVEPLVAPRSLLQRLLMIGQQITPPPDATGQDRLVWRAETDSFWKEMRRRTYTGWGDDGDRDNNPSESANDGLPVNRFRTALERLLATKPAAAPDYGFLSYSACWYTIVEAYTRSQLTFSTDRFVAISSMVKRIQQSTGRVYAAGLWEDSLVTDILWFVPGTPGARVHETLSPRQKDMLRDAQRPSTATPMAPTWSWMSVDAAVSIDLLASNADIIFRGKSLITACSVSVKDVDTDPRSKVFNAVEGTLIAEGPLLPCRVRFLANQGRWFLFPPNERLIPHAAFFPDISQDCEWDEDLDLYCLAVLEITTLDGAKFAVRTETGREVKGIVLKRSFRLFAPPNSFEQVGYFTTKHIGFFGRLGRIHERFKEAPRERVHVT
ncbi:hypothetical protein FDECE_13861 [Fusarium decemcellulare]|nr:hypothetical protein FDECE_13861 [Fusarium decemcellulare]